MYWRNESSVGEVDTRLELMDVEGSRMASSLIEEEGQETGKRRKSG